MAVKKKFYAVKKGKTTGIFESWDQCKAAVDGYPGAQYKGFALLEEAEAYLAGKNLPEGIYASLASKEQMPSDDEAIKTGRDLPEENTLLTYVDGSFEESVNKYSFGCVFITSEGRIFIEFGNGDNERSLQHRNVTGEMLGAMYAVKTAMFNGYKKIEIRYDYEGIEKWVTGEWRAKTELTQKYKNAMLECSKSIRVVFTKVSAHTNVYYNELADKLAKRGLVEGAGVPKVRSLEELQEWNRPD